MKPQSEARIAQLIRQFPICGQLIDSHRPPFGVEFCLRIGVRRADVSLLSVKLSNFDGQSRFLVDDNSWLGTQQESANLIINGSRLLYSMQPNQRVRDFLNRQDVDKVNHLVWRTQVDWFEPVTNYRLLGCRAPSGRLVRRELYITIYLPPKKGSFRSLMLEAIPLNRIRYHLKFWLRHDLFNRQFGDCQEQMYVLGELDRLTGLLTTRVYQLWLRSTFLNHQLESGVITDSEIRITLEKLDGKINITLEDQCANTLIRFSSSSQNETLSLEEAEGTLLQIRQLVVAAIDALGQTPRDLSEMIR